MTKILDSNAARILAYLMAVIGIVYLGFEVVTLMLLHRDLYCGAQDGDCIRDWVGATSGWAAALAAGMTIFAIRSQMTQAERHYNDRLDREESAANRLARKALNLSYLILTELEMMQASADERYPEPSPARDGFFVGALTSVEQKLKSKDLDDYETRVGDAREVLDHLQKQVEILRGFILLRGSTDPYDPKQHEAGINEMMVGLVPLATTYFTHVGTVNIARGDLD